MRQQRWAQFPAAHKHKAGKKVPLKFFFRL